MVVLNHAKSLRLGTAVIAAAHLDRHRVFPLPPAFLRSTVGQVSTPDAAIDTIVGDTRWNGKVTLVDPGSSDLQTMSAKRQSSGAQMGWHFRVSSGALVLLLPDPTASGVHSANLGSVMGLPLDVPIYLRAEVVGMPPGNMDVRGYYSLDGVTWTPTGGTIRYANYFPLYDATWLVRIGTYGGGTVFYKGKIFNTDMWAINRAQLALPGAAGNWLSVPDSVPLNVTGDFEMVARVSRPDWAATYASIVAKDQSGIRGYIVRVAFNAINFVVPTVDGASSNAVNSSSLAGTAGQTMWLKVTRVATTGAVAFFSAPDQETEPTSWTARGTATTPAGAMPTNTSPVQIGARGGAAIEPWLGRIARVIVRDVIGTTPQFVFPGVTGNGLTTPDTAALRITGDITVIGRVAMNDWATGAGTIVARFSTPQQGFMLQMNTAGRLIFYWSTDGTVGTAKSHTSSAIAGLVNGQPIWVAATLDVDNGAGGYDLRFWSSTDGTTWAQVGATITVAGVTSIVAGTNPTVIGQRVDAGSPWPAGRIYRVIVRNGIAAGGAPTGGTTALDLDESNIRAGWDTSVTATSGQIFTEIGNVIRGRVLDVSENDAAKASASSAPFLNLYGSASVNTVTTPDAPDLNISGDVRVIARVRDDSVESSGSRYWIYKGTAPSDYGYSMLATYTTYQYATQGWPTGASSPAGSIIMGSRTEFGTTPPGTDLYLRADITGVNPASQALTQTARGYKSTDGNAWTAAGTPSTSVRADAMTRDAAAKLMLGYVAIGRLYSAQVETINRAQLIFPGVVGNYLSTPFTANLAITGPLEIVARCAFDWQASTKSSWIVSRFAGGGQRSYGLLMEGTYPGRIRLIRSYDGSGIGDTATATISVPFTNGQMGWVKATHDAAGTTRFYTAPDAGDNVEPTVWSQLGGDRTGYSPATFAGTAALWVGDAPISGPGGFPDEMLGRIARVIVRNGIGGGGTVVFDLDENNAGTMGAATTFPATSGNVMTVNSTSLALYPIVTPQAPAVVWRFDASEATTDALSFTDARGRVWTLANAGAIARAREFTATSGQLVTSYSTPGSADLVTPQPDSILWRFDANEWPPGATSIVDAQARTWTASNGDALEHPASIPDSEVHA